MTTDITTLEFHTNAWGQFLAKLPGRAETVVVEPVRCFPLTHPREQISLLDEEGREVLRIPALDDLPAVPRQRLEQVLTDREFMPVIQRILRAGSSPPCAWDVETDRGTTRFEIDSEDDLRKLADGTVIIADNNGVRYRIPRSESLDAASRAILRRFL